MSSLFLSFQAFPQSVAVPVAINDTSIMGQSIQQGRCEGWVAEQLGSVRKAEIGGDDHGAPFVTIRHHLKQYGSSGKCPDRLMDEVES